MTPRAQCIACITKTHYSSQLGLCSGIWGSIWGSKDNINCPKHGILKAKSTSWHLTQQLWGGVARGRGGASLKLAF